jgi:hypothetical protein
MTWTAPMTAVAGDVYTAAQWNTCIRDNLNETAVAKAQTASGYSVVAGYNRLVQRVSGSASSDVAETTDSTSYSDLEADPGPALTLLTGTRALVSIFGSGRTTGGTAAWIAFAVSGATSLEAADTYAVQLHVTTADQWRAGATFGLDTLTPGLNTFTMKYRVSSSGTGTFSSRKIAVIPL